MSFKFENTPSDMVLMAAFVAQLVREGVMFKVESGPDYIVTLTGGF